MEDKRPQRRPRVHAGVHTAITGKPYPALLCNGEIHSAWFTRAGVRCNRCWHLLDELQSTTSHRNLITCIRAVVGQNTTLIADDFDDSEAGLKVLGAKVQTRLPYLRLSPAPRQRRLFKVASLLATLHKLDENVMMGWRERSEAAEALESKLKIELTELVKVAVK